MDFSIQELRAFARSSGWDTAPQSDQDREIPAPPIFPVCPDGAELISLPSPDTCQTVSKDLLNVIRDRQSCRAYQQKSLTLAELSFLLYCNSL